MTMHYASSIPPAEGDKWPPRDELGITLADVSSTTRLNGMPEGVLGLVYLGYRNGVDEAFKENLKRWTGNPRVWGYYFIDEPYQIPVAAIKAQIDYVREHHPGAMCFIKLTNQTSVAAPSWHPYNIESTGADLLGIGGYCVRARFPGGYDPELIERYVTSAVRDGIPIERLVPCMQCFGGVPDWPIPTKAQMDEMFANWRRLVPHPVFDMCYAWNVQPAWGTESLANNEMMRDAVRRHFAAQAAGPVTSLKVAIALDGEPVAEVTLAQGSTLTLAAS